MSKTETEKPVKTPKKIMNSEVSITHAIILSHDPYYIMAHNEESAIEVSEKYGSSCIGIIVAPKGLSMKSIQKKTILADIEIKALPLYSVSDDGMTVEEVIGSEDEVDFDEEELDILNINKPLGE